MSSESLDPAYLASLTTAEKERLSANELASDGAEVVAGIEAPSEDELLAYLHEAGSRGDA